MDNVPKQMQKLAKKNFYKVGTLHIHCYTKNTIFTLIDQNGKVLHQISSKSSNIKDYKRNTYFVVRTLSNKLVKFILMNTNIKYLKCFIKGISVGRYNFIRSFKRAPIIRIIYIKDNTPYPFNGCRPKKKKRR